jgi:23S rRNA (pseudouridine1915-N3)-methyltransferase
MRLVVLAVGRLRPYYRDAADDYQRRIGRFADLREVEIREASRAGPPERQRAVDAEKLVAKIPDRATVVALAREGKAWTSHDVARHLERWDALGAPVALLIGGSHGLDPSLIKRATVSWSLGPLTLPHELARVVVYEQVYRGFTILNHMPYHKGAARA